MTRRSTTLDTNNPVAFDATIPDPEDSSPAEPIRARTSPLAAGQHVGRYVVTNPLGAGGMGVVFAAHDPDLGREVAIKVVRSDVDDPDAASRITREAHAMARVDHPNVVAIHDVGTLDDGRVFIAMERVSGTNLRQWLEQRTRSIAEIIEVFTAAGHGLIGAHDAGMVHGDFKPDNVLVGDDGRTRVTDFGLAEDNVEDLPVDTDSEREKTRVVGTPSYMAPEQHLGGRVDARTDQFSFAVALYEALYGTKPFTGRTYRELAGAILNGRIEPQTSSRVPASLRSIIFRALSIKPGDRYPTMAELLRALGRDRGRRPRQVATVAAVVFALVAVAFGADWIMRDRARVVARTRFSAARSHLEKLLALRTNAFEGQSDALYALPVMREVVASRDLADFGLGEETEDLDNLTRIHDTLRSADWVGLTRTNAGDVVAIADHKGRLLFNSASPAWGMSITTIPALAEAYAAGTEIYIGVLDAADPQVVASKLLGGAARKLYVAFAGTKQIGAQPRAMFVQLIEATQLLSDVGIGDETYLSVVTREGVAAGTVPEQVIKVPVHQGIEEIVVGNSTWLVERAPLRAQDQGNAIAEIVLAQTVDVGLTGLFPRARFALGALLGVFATLALGGFAVARIRDLSR